MIFVGLFVWLLLLNLILFDSVCLLRLVCLVDFRFFVLGVGLFDFWVFSGRLWVFCCLRLFSYLCFVWFWIFGYGLLFWVIVLFMLLGILDDLFYL